MFGEYWYIYVLPFVGGLILYAIIKALVRAPGASLNTKFAQLGTLKGKTLQEITSVCGQPNSVSINADGNKVYQWLATGYHIVLLFDNNDICLGVASEAKV